jgi:hypothetical protein
MKNFRVVNECMLYAFGMPKWLAKDIKNLKSSLYFGQYGTILRIVVS